MEPPIYVVLDAHSVEDSGELEGMISAPEGLKELKQIYVSLILICPAYPR